MSCFGRLISGFAGFAMLVAQVPAHAEGKWWNDQWAYRKEITLDLSPTGAAIAGTATDVPVLIRLSLGNFAYFNDTKPDGSDLRFMAADDKTPLKFHVERFDAQAQMAFVWVTVPRLTGGANTDKVFLYYGNKDATAGADAAGSYDKNQALVYHFGAATNSPQDVTAYKNEALGFTAEVNPASLIGAGVKFAGGQTISIPASGSLRLLPAQGITLSAWVRVESAQSQTYVAQLAQNVNLNARELVLGIEGQQAFARYTDGTPVQVGSTSALSTGEWHHLALIAGNGRLELLVDGELAGSAPVTLSEIGGTLTIGGAAAGANYLIGELDELEVSNIARPDDFLRAAARSQGVIAPLVVYGGDASRESDASQSYIGTTLKSVTLDGWVIIGILAVLFFLSIAIMVGKFLFLNRVAKGNGQFLKQFRKMRDDPAALEKTVGAKAKDDEEAGEARLPSIFDREDPDTFGSSTLWRLYHHGMRETLSRFQGQAAGADRVRSLSAQSIEAIRATLDATHTRMTQQLSAQMVWLTISIAGGPFLGLLGTVVGVMITFAAIAVAGDVNVNAIAPGTAAALVATVAGLGVAIPCLFGYNYLNTRIKEIGADNHVFVDEFVTRIAETYS
jgi:biopolymer transport protein ExbB